MDESTRIWRDRVARWHNSGHSARVFAEQERVNPGTLYSWSRRLGMKRSGSPQSSEKAMPPQLLPVVVAASGSAAPSSGTALEVVMPDGVVICAVCPPSLRER